MLPLVQAVGALQPVGIAPVWRLGLRACMGSEISVALSVEASVRAGR